MWGRVSHSSPERTIIDRRWQSLWCSVSISTYSNMLRIRKDPSKVHVYLLSQHYLHPVKVVLQYRRENTTWRHCQVYIVSSLLLRIQGSLWPDISSLKVQGQRHYQFSTSKCIIFLNWCYMYDEKQLIAVCMCLVKNMENGDSAQKWQEFDRMFVGNYYMLYSLQSHLLRAKVWSWVSLM